MQIIHYMQHLKLWFFYRLSVDPKTTTSISSSKLLDHLSKSYLHCQIYAIRDISNMKIIIICPTRKAKRLWAPIFPGMGWMLWWSSERSTKNRITKKSFPGINDDKHSLHGIVKGIVNTWQKWTRWIKLNWYFLMQFFVIEVDKQVAVRLVTVSIVTRRDVIYWQQENKAHSDKGLQHKFPGTKWWP